MSTVERAIAIAAEAHAGQIDKAGAPYILHPLRVMLAMATDKDHARIEKYRRAIERLKT